MNHAIVRTDCLAATKNRDLMVSLFVSEQDGVDNGYIAALAGLKDEEREIYNIDFPNEAFMGYADIVLISTPELDSVKEYGLDSFYNKYQNEARGYKLHDGDIFSVTEEALEKDESVDEIVVGDYIIATDSYKMVVSENPAVDGSEDIDLGCIIDINIVAGTKFYAIEVGQEGSPEHGGDASSSLVGTGVVGSMIVGTDSTGG